MLLSSIHPKGNIAYNISREPESYQENCRCFICIVNICFCIITEERTICP